MDRSARRLFGRHVAPLHKRKETPKLTRDTKPPLLTLGSIGLKPNCARNMGEDKSAQPVCVLGKVIRTLSQAAVEHKYFGHGFDGRPYSGRPDLDPRDDCDAKLLIALREVISAHTVRKLQKAPCGTLKLGIGKRFGISGIWFCDNDHCG